MRLNKDYSHHFTETGGTILQKQVGPFLHNCDESLCLMNLSVKCLIRTLNNDWGNMKDVRTAGTGYNKKPFLYTDPIRNVNHGHNT